MLQFTENPQRSAGLAVRASQRNLRLSIAQNPSVRFAFVGAQGPTGAAGANGTNGTNGADGADGVVQTIVAGSNITVDATDPANPIVASTATGVTDGDKGDITVSSSGAAWAIDNDVVSNAKLDNMAQSTIKGRAAGAGTGDPTDLSESQVKTVLGLQTSTTDNAAVRYDSTAGNQQGSALIIADTTGALSRSGGGGIQVEGTNTNDNAAAGEKGEYTSASASAVALSTGTNADVTSVSLTAGDWDVDGFAQFNPAGTTVISAIQCAISTVSVTQPSVPGEGRFLLQGPLGTGLSQYVNTGVKRISISSTTTVYLVCLANFTTSTCTAHGFIRARRIR